LPGLWIFFFFNMGVWIRSENRTRFTTVAVVIDRVRVPFKYGFHWIQWKTNVGRRFEYRTSITKSGFWEREGGAQGYEWTELIQYSSLIYIYKQTCKHNGQWEMFLYRSVEENNLQCTFQWYWNSIAYLFGIDGVDPSWRTLIFKNEID